MKNLIKNSGNIILLMWLITSQFSAQNYKRLSQKLLEQNETVQAFSYIYDNTYSRSIKIKDSILYAGNANGSLTAFDLKLIKSINLMRDIKFQEIRDVEITGKYIYGMQSGKQGKLVQFDENRNAKVLDFDMWNDVFFNGMSFHENVGFLMGDPVDTTFSLFYTLDYGNTWQPCEGKIKSIADEVGYAASGTNVQVINDSTFVFVTGGWKSRVFTSYNRGKTWDIKPLPFFAGTGNGAFSVCFINNMNGVIVGGDYKNPHLNLNCIYYTPDGGISWLKPSVDRLVRGYRSCVIQNRGIFYACGPNGIDFSPDGGEKWYPFANGEYFTLEANGDYLFASMKNGKVKKFHMLPLKK